MSMKASEIIASLAAAIQRYGDLPCDLEDSMISEIYIHPTADGFEAFENGKRVHIPTEFTIEFIPPKT